MTQHTLVIISKFIFLLYDRVYPGDYTQKLYSCGMLGHTYVITAQNIVFLWYGMAYLSNCGAQ